MRYTNFYQLRDTAHKIPDRLWAGEGKRIARTASRLSSTLPPADVYCGRAQTILLKRQRIKQQTIRQRRLLNLKQAA